MKHVPAIAVTLVMLLLLAALPPSVYAKAALIALGLVLGYFCSRAAADGGYPAPKEAPLIGQAELSGRAGSEPRVAVEQEQGPLDDELVARIVDNLKTEPSERLREILAQSAGDRWSPEAVHVARLLLEQRSNDGTAE